MNNNEVVSKELIEALRINADAHPLDVDQPVMTNAADALESQAREIERLTQHIEQQDDAYSLLSLDAGRKMDELEQQIASLKLQPSGVVLPERKPVEPLDFNRTTADVEAIAHNACLDEVARLNSSPASAGDREALIYLMERFDNEVWVCPRCSHEEPTNDMDSASYLREYLAGAQPASAGDERPIASCLRGQFETWAMETEHPVFGYIGSDWLDHGDDPNTYANDYMQGAWVMLQARAQLAAPAGVVVPPALFDQAISWIEDRRRYGDEGTLPQVWHELKTIQRDWRIAAPSPAPTALMCATMQRPVSECGCPDCGSSLIDWPAPAGKSNQKPIQVEAVAVTRKDEDGELYLDWLLEGGISALEHAGQTLLIAHGKIADDCGSGTVYTQARAALSANHSEQVREGYVQVPKSMLLEANSLEALVFVGGGITGDDGVPTYIDCVLWVGDLLDDDGKAIHGLHAYCTECEEEGSTTLAEFAAAPSAGSQKEQGE